MNSLAATRAMAKNSLANLGRSCSTDRVLNLSRVYQQHRETEAYQQAPLFKNPRLNRSIFLKHTLRMHERDPRKHGRMTVTKLILPFDSGELSIGGFSSFLSDVDVDRTIAAQFGGDISSPAFQRDLSVIRIMDSLPTFDPFLLRERLKRDGISVARCYFDLSEADATRMRQYVHSEIQKIVSLAFSGNSNLREQSSTMVDKLMTDETAESLEPLRQVLQLSGEEYRDGIFAWKGFLYYSWNIDATTKFMPVLLEEMLGARIKRATKQELSEIEAIRRRISCCLTYLNQVAHNGVELYRAAYKELLNGKPMAFQQFLKDSPAKFLEVGEAFGMIMHIRSFWNFRFKMYPGYLLVEDALEIFRDFDAQVAAIYDQLD
ncbi:MAG: hypothetical protein ACK51S_09030 [Alphaproteobacteria bacterium]